MAPTLYLDKRFACGGLLGPRWISDLCHPLRTATLGTGHALSAGTAPGDWATSALPCKAYCPLPISYPRSFLPAISPGKCYHSPNNIPTDFKGAPGLCRGPMPVQPQRQRKPHA